MSPPAPPPAGTPDFDDVKDPELAEYEQWEATALAATIDAYVVD